MEKVVLIVEDEPALRSALAEEFSAAGFAVHEAGDGIEGAQKARQLKPDVILLDLLMPKKGGVEMMADLEDEPWAKDIPVIVLTNVELGDKKIEEIVKDNPTWYLMKADQTLEEVREKAETMLLLSDKPDPDAGKF